MPHAPQSNLFRRLWQSMQKHPTLSAAVSLSLILSGLCIGFLSAGLATPISLLLIKAGAAKLAAGTAVRVAAVDIGFSIVAGTLIAKIGKEIAIAAKKISSLFSWGKSKKSAAIASKSLTPTRIPASAASLATQATAAQNKLSAVQQARLAADARTRLGLVALIPEPDKYATDAQYQTTEERAAKLGLMASEAATSALVADRANKAAQEKTDLANAAPSQVITKATKRRKQKMDAKKDSAQDLANSSKAVAKLTKQAAELANKAHSIFASATDMQKIEVMRVLEKLDEASRAALNSAELAEKVKKSTTVSAQKTVAAKKLATGTIAIAQLRQRAKRTIAIAKKAEAQAEEIIIEEAAKKIAEAETILNEIADEPPTEAEPNSPISESTQTLFYHREFENSEGTQTASYWEEPEEPVDKTTQFSSYFPT